MGNLIRFPFAGPSGTRRTQPDKPPTLPLSSVNLSVCTLYMDRQNGLSAHHVGPCNACTATGGRIPPMKGERQNYVLAPLNVACPINVSLGQCTEYHGIS